MIDGLRAAQMGIGYVAFPRRIVMALCGLACLALLSGCGYEPPRFRLNMQGRDPAEFMLVGGEDENAIEFKESRAQARQTIASVLEALFGNPDEPYVMPETGLDAGKIRLASGPVRHDASGTTGGLYRQHCAHCHGISGDGAGPTAAFLNPYPRDYRQGKFKFKSTERNAKPTDDDLKRILMDGIPGTAMPSFRLLPEDELAALVEYVKYLSIRGETELMLGFMLYDNEEEIEPVREEVVGQFLMPVVDFWNNAESEVVTPADPPSMETPAERSVVLAQGREIFFGAKAQCIKCHGPTALGDGLAQQDYDDWNKLKKDNPDYQWLLPIQAAQPRNLRLGIYRFGRRPVDMYRRVYAGINGTPMPNMGQSPSNPNGLTSDEIWSVVEYVRSLPYEPASRPQPNETAVHRERQ